MYDYIEAMKEDIRGRVSEDVRNNWVDWEDRDQLNDLLWNDDSVTGNASGSYYCNSYRAKEAILGDPHAEEYIQDLISEFGMDAKTIAKHFMDWEYWDVSIRCYLLGQVLGEMSDEELHINV